MSAPEREIHFTPAFHKCPRYGIGSVVMLWVLRRDGWAMTWDVHTDWGLPKEEFKAASPNCAHPSHQAGYPSMGCGLGGAVDWHSPVPLHDNHPAITETCKWLDGPCHLSSGFMLGTELFELLCTKGHEAVWERLGELLDARRNELEAST